MAGKTYRELAAREFAGPCGRCDALPDVGIAFPGRQRRLRQLPRPEAKAKSHRAATPKKLEPV
jgi:hypothetical protein